jgi:hypothetical protein
MNKENGWKGVCEQLPKNMGLVIDRYEGQCDLLQENVNSFSACSDTHEQSIE